MDILTFKTESKNSSRSASTMLRSSYGRRLEIPLCCVTVGVTFTCNTCLYYVEYQIILVSRSLTIDNR